MSASAFRLTDLPVETLEQVLLHLTGQDVIKMEAISRQFRDLIRDSPMLQYKRELFSAGLIENPCSPCDFAQRRKLFEEYKCKWSDAGRVVKTIHEFPEELSLGDYFRTSEGWNLIGYRSTSTGDGNLMFVRVPPVTSQRPIEWWSIPPLSFHARAYAVYPPDNLLAIAEHKGRSVWIHLLNLSDGSAYCGPPSNVIVWEFSQLVSKGAVRWVQITSSRVMMDVYCWEVARSDGFGVENVSVWDWKTGDLILSLPSTDGSTAVGRDTTLNFLDEFRIVVLTRPIAPDVLEFILFDTLVPRGHPANSRRFRFPLRYHDWYPSVYFDNERCLGTLDQDGPFTTDPTQADFVIKLDSHLGPSIFLIVRIQALVGRALLASTDAYVPWDMWGRDAVIIGGVPILGSTNSGPYPLVQGVHVIVMGMDDTRPDDDVSHLHPILSIFDLSRRGRNDLGGGGAELKVLFEDGEGLSLPGDEGLVEWGFDSLSNGMLEYLSYYPLPAGASHVWELI